MKKAYVLLAMAALLVAFMPSSPRAIAQSEPREAESELLPPTPAAPVGFNGRPIEAEIKFFDNGSEITAIGEAENLIPGKTYVSLVYDVGSVATGPDACEPTIFPPDPRNLEGKMFLGVWTVNSNGEGTLRGTLEAHTPIGTFATVSVRDTSINNGRGPQAVAACGLVVAEDDSDDD